MGRVSLTDETHVRLRTFSECRVRRQSRVAMAGYTATTLARFCGLPILLPVMWLALSSRLFRTRFLARFLLAGHQSETMR